MENRISHGRTQNKVVWNRAFWDYFGGGLLQVEYISMYLNEIQTGKLDQKVARPRDLSRRIFIAVYQYGRPNSGDQKRKYILLYTVFIYYRVCFFLLTLHNLFSSTKKTYFGHCKLCQSMKDL